MPDSYQNLFHAALGRDDLAPYPYQTALAEAPDWPDLLDIPTGLGKTAAVTLAWLYKRGWRPGGRGGATDPATPRRLVWCLPMRVLVEQTTENIRSWLQRLGIHGAEAGQGRVSVHVLMGGESDLTTWAEHPEEDMILIGTQDMLLSRALMRGYGMSRYQWPIHFALLHNDCLWAYDEVQLMGPGLTTSTQLDGLRRAYPLGRGSRSLWLSATLNRDWLASIDLVPHLPGLTTLALSEADRAQAGEHLHAVKHLAPAATRLTADNLKKGAAEYLDSLCTEILAAHDPTSQTLVIVNRVDRAQGLFQRLRKARPQAADLLIHARFRAAERRQAERALSTGDDRDRIVVATQAIEAGVDVSSRLLYTELAPWSSLVQRIGRCNRYGEHNAGGGARVVWIDLADDADPLPYAAEPLAGARAKLAGLTEAGPAALPATDETRPPGAVLRRKDLLDLFNTDPDLSGFDVDVADYIRDSGQPGLQLFWRELTDGDPNAGEPQAPAARDELCPVGLTQAQTLLKRKGVSAWRWDSLAGQWVKLDGRPRPGQTLLLDAAAGGYDPALGVDASSKQAVTVIDPRQSQGHETYAADWRSRTQRPIGLPEHLGHVAAEAAALCQVLGEQAHAQAVIRAGRWHDLGKAHAVFDASMHRCPEAPPALLAKSNCPGPLRHARAQFRHELASALAWLAQHDDPQHPDASTDLIAYLIAAHHGKVRMSLRALPDEPAAPDGVRYARGIWEGDVLPALDFDGEHSATTELRLALMELGEGAQGRSWSARTLALLDHHGPFRLAWLETLIRLADWRASAAEQIASPPDNAENPAHGLEDQHPTLAPAGPSDPAAHPSGPTAAQGGAQHELRGRAGGSGDAGTRTATPDHATRQLETTLGVISYAELAPHLALRVERTAVAIADGEFDQTPLDEHLIRALHRRICGDLTPQFAGQWRRINVLVGTHEPPQAAQIPLRMRDYAADLDTRVRHLPTEPDETWLEVLAFAEGHLLGIHPFQDFNGRTTRLLIDLLLQRLNLPAIDPIPAYGQPTENYLAALRAADRHDWGPLMAIWRERLEQATDD